MVESSKKRGRKPEGERAMTAAERKRKQVLRKKEWLKERGLIMKNLPLKESILKDLESVALLAQIDYVSNAHILGKDTDNQHKFDINYLLSQALHIGSSIVLKELLNMVSKTHEEIILSEGVEEQLNETLAQVSKLLSDDQKERTNASSK